ncbi:MAG: Bifunctional homocysteine S-methyltransferase/5,10-methylenetetrahydrofolate reductase [Promethearchaeota archaeon]|jgi:5,10-methylenetetrahydrofolate reductase|nr:MAG: Bifunctional homocysteine S-methyltransferase/5,10-methylenetetrahydrofolate reductase [Candidatus Lokiarchaeota archaeon]
MTNRPAFSNLCKKIEEGHFTITGELEPKKILDLEEIIESAKEMKRTKKIAAANVTDGPQGDAYMCSLVPSYKVQEKAGIEAVWQVTVRDRNRVALFGDVLGAAVMGLKNILVLTGDHTALGDHKKGRAVYDLDSTQFCDMLSKMIDEGTDLEGNELKGGKIEMNYGCVANPNSNPREPEIMKVGRKVEQGVDFIQTQTAFDIDEAKDFLKDLEQFNVPVLLGIFPLKSYGIAWYFDNYIPGVSVPKNLLKSLKTAEKENKGDKPAKYAAIDKINIEFFKPFIEEIKKTTKAAGIHCMAVEYERLFDPLLKEFEEYTYL